jgi:histidinol-phosphate/aromatic aminotransferase/cobyric acid decarboxylase-like protein
LQRLVPVRGVAVVQTDELNPALLANKHQALVLDNPQQPSGKFSIPVEFSNVLERLPASILRFLFRFATVTEDESG